MTELATQPAQDLAEPPIPLVFTDNAAAKVADLIAEDGNPELKLRVFVQGGGCSGFQYGSSPANVSTASTSVFSGKFFVSGR